MLSERGQRLANGKDENKSWLSAQLGHLICVRSVGLVVGEAWGSLTQTLQRYGVQMLP